MTLEPIVLTNNYAKALILPRAGGRIIGFEALGREWLWRNPELISKSGHFIEKPEVAQLSTTLGTWKNWGGDKSWPAPQGWNSRDEWAGPPDPILDSGPYFAEISKEGLRCRMTSASDPRTGLKIERTIELTPDSPGLLLTTRMTNISTEKRTWACWTITQVAIDEVQGVEVPKVIVEQNQRFPPVTLFESVGKPIAKLTKNGHYEIHVEDVVGKLGFPGASGLIELHSSDTLVFRQTFYVDKLKPYPDQNSKVEIWMQFPVRTPIESLAGLKLTAALVELECLGPLEILQPGQSTSLDVRWTVVKK